MRHTLFCLLLSYNTSTADYVPRKAICNGVIINDETRRKLLCFILRYVNYVAEKNSEKRHSGQRGRGQVRTEKVWNASQMHCHSVSNI
jgi:hypothetical protein